MKEELDDLLLECGPFELFEFPNTLLKLDLIADFVKQSASHSEATGQQIPGEPASRSDAAAAGCEILRQCFDEREGLAGIRSALQPIAARCVKLLDQLKGPSDEATSTTAPADSSVDKPASMNRLREIAVAVRSPLYWPAENWVSDADRATFLLSVSHQLILLDDTLACLELGLRDRSMENAPLFNLTFAMGMAMGSTIAQMQHCKVLARQLANSASAAERGGLRSISEKFTPTQKNFVIDEVFRRLADGSSMRSASQDANVRLFAEGSGDQELPSLATIRRWVQEKEMSMVRQVADRIHHRKMTHQEACQDVQRAASQTGIAVTIEQLERFLADHPALLFPYDCGLEPHYEMYWQRLAEIPESRVEVAFSAFEQLIHDDKAVPPATP